MRDRLLSIFAVVPTRDARFLFRGAPEGAEPSDAEGVQDFFLQHAVAPGAERLPDDHPTAAAVARHLGLPACSVFETRVQEWEMCCWAHGDADAAMEATLMTPLRQDPRDLLLTEPYVSECLLAFNDARALRRMHPRSKAVREHLTCTEVEVARGLRRLLRPPLRELRFSWAPSCRVSDERSPGFLAPVVFARSASGPTVLQAFQVTPAVLDAALDRPADAARVADIMRRAVCACE
jgi:hypothetical protein